MMNDIHARLARTRGLVAALEEREVELAKMKKKTASLERRHIEVRADLAHRRKVEAEIRLEALASDVAEKRAELVQARASGGGEEEAKALKEAEERLADPETLMAGEIFHAAYEIERKAWSEHVARYREEMVEEHRIHGDRVLAQVRAARERLADAREQWAALDKALHFAVRRDGYQTGSSGSGDIGAFPGLDGPLRPAVPRDLRQAPADPTMMTRAGEAAFVEDGVPVETA